MPPIELGVGSGIAKYAPIIFLAVDKNGKAHFNMHQLAHTLLVSAIVAGSAYGAIRSEVSDIKEQQRELITELRRVALRQAAVIAQANEIHMHLQEGQVQLKIRLDALEKRKD